MDFSEDVLCIGDHISLFDDECQGYAMAQGFAGPEQISVGVVAPQDNKPVPYMFSNGAVFEVWPMQTFNASHELRAQRDEEAMGDNSRRSTIGGSARKSRMTLGGLKGSPGNQSSRAQRIVRLEQDAEREMIRNHEEFDAQKGRELTYGTVITLRHSGSGLYLALSEKSSEQNREARRIILSNEMGEEMYFRVLPLFERVYSEGDAVHEGDHIQFECMSSPGLKLHVSLTRKPLRGCAWLEVQALKDATPFKLQLFRSIRSASHESSRYSSLARPSTKPLLHGGTPVRMRHMEANGYVQAECDTGAVAVHSMPSSNNIWQIERESAMNGSTVTWDTQVRIRHVGTEKLLSVPQRTSGSNPRAVPQLRSKPAELVEDAADRVQTTLNAEGDTTATLFTLVPQHTHSGDTRVALGSHMWLRHVETGYWLSCPSGTELTTSDVPSAASAGSPSADEKPAPLLACRERQEMDVFMLEPVELDQTQDMFYGKNAKDALVTFESYVEDAERVADLKPKFGDLEAVLTNLIFFCSLSDNTDPMTREGLPLKAKQTLLCEILVMEHAMDLCEKLLEKGKDVLDRRLLAPPPKGSEADDKKDLRERQELHRVLTRTLKLCQRLMRHILRGNATTRSYAAAEHRGFVHKLQLQMDAAILATETLREIFVDNATLLESIPTETLEAVIELIKTKGRKPRYIDFLEVLCTCKGQAVRTNQWRLANLLFSDENRDLLLELHLQHGDLFISGNKKYFPTFSEGSGSMKLMKWLRAPPPRDCIKCGVRPIAVKFACGHARCCRECVGRLRQLDNACPICHAPIGTDMEVGDHVGLEAAEDHKEIRVYFERTISLYQSLVVGRNQRTTELIRHVMPYKLVEAIILSAEQVMDYSSNTQLASKRGSLSLVHVGDRAGRRASEPFWNANPLMKLCASFAGIARSLYVDAEPHEVMTRVKVMRIWDEVEEIERSGKLASKNTMNVKHDFEKLQYFMYNFLRNNAQFQVATRFDLNFMILNVLKLMHDMVLYGFFDSGIKSEEESEHPPADKPKVVEAAPAAEEGDATPRRREAKEKKRRSDGFEELKDDDEDEGGTILPPLLSPRHDPRPGVKQLIPILLCVLDGRKDRMDEDDADDEGSSFFDFEAERHKQWKTISCDTVTIMESKLWACKILQLVCTMRVDIRLSKLLHRYQQVHREVERNLEQAGAVQAMKVVGRSDVRRGSTAQRLLDLDKLKEGADDDDKAKHRKTQTDKLQTLLSDVTRKLHMPQKLDDIMTVLKIPQIQSQKWLFDMLLDCTYYEHTELRNAALGLLIRHFEQKIVLANYASQVQIIVNKRMVRMYSLFDELRRRLAKFAARRRLLEEQDEAFQTVHILSQLTSWLYDQDSSGAALVAQAQRKNKLLATDHAQFVFLKLIGKAQVTVGSNQVEVSMLANCLQPDASSSAHQHRPYDVDEAMPRSGAEIQLAGEMYRVVRANDMVLELDRPFQWPDHPAELQKRTHGEEWLMLLCHIIKPDRDMQLMMLNLQSGEIVHNAIKLLGLNFNAAKVELADVKIRAVLTAVYRFLKAFCSAFPSGQSALAPSLSTFLAHCEADLVTSDVSPMGCINTIYKDNHTVCATVEMDAVRKVASLAADKQAPRYLRFLSNLLEANERLIVSNQAFVVKALEQQQRAMLLYNHAEGRLERQALIEAEEHIRNPRGKLVYHIELIKLLGLATKGNHAENQVWVQRHLPLVVLAEHLRTRDAPIPLVAAYIDLLRNVYLTGDRKTGSATKASAISSVEDALRGLVAKLTERCAEEGADHEQIRLVFFDFVLPALRDVYRRFRGLMQDMEMEEADDGDRFERFQQAKEAQARDLLECADKVIKSGSSVDEEKTLADAPDVVQACVAAIVDNDDVSEELLTEALGYEVNFTVFGLGENSVAVGLKSTLRRSDATEEPTDEMHYAMAAIQHHHHPQGQFDAFLEELIPQARVEDEFEGLINIFTADISSASTADMPSGHTRNLIQQLSASAGRDAPLTDDQLQQTATCLRILSELILQTRPDWSDEPLAFDAKWQVMRKRQVELNSMGASAVALSMAACDNSQLCEAGLKLSAALLYGSNQEVQTTMHALLSDPKKQVAIRPFDGVKQTFLSQMRERLQLGCTEIAARKFYREHQKDRQSTLQEDTKGLGPSAKKRYEQLVNQPFPSRAQVLEVLQTLQMMCAGHNARMQDLFHMQPAETAQVDLVAEVANLAEHLSRELDGSNIEQLVMCVATLKEMVQGNASGSNVHRLLSTKLLELLGKLLDMPAMSKRKSLTRHETLRLQRHCSELLLAVVEEDQDGQVAERMLHTLDMQNLAFFALRQELSARQEMPSSVGLQHLAKPPPAATPALRISTFPSARRSSGKINSGGDDDSFSSGSVPHAPEKQEQRDVGFNVYLLLRYLLDYELAKEAHDAELSAAAAHHSVTSGKTETTSKALKALATAFDGDPDVLQWYARLVCRVDIGYAHGVSRRHYFRVPEACLLLLDGNESTMPSADQLKTHAQQVLWGVSGLTADQISQMVAEARAEPGVMSKARKAMLWGVDRSKRSTQIRDFFKGAEELRFQMRHMKALRENALWNTITRYPTLAFGSIFYIACVQNLFLLVLYSSHDREVQPETDHVMFSSVLRLFKHFSSGPGSERLEWLITILLGTLQTAACLLSFANASILYGPRQLKRAELWPTRSRFDKKPSRWSEWPHLSLLRRLALLAKVASVLLATSEILYALVFFVAAVVGLLVSPLWFSLHLLEILKQSRALQYAFRSVTIQGSSIAMTAAFGLLLIYIYAVAGFGLLPRTAFIEPDHSISLSEQLSSEPLSGRALRGDEVGAEMGAEDDGDRLCENLFYCFLEAMNQGLRARDIGVIMHDPDPAASWGDYTAVLVYQFSFYCLVVTVLLSVILGIIVDAFSQLRAEEYEKMRHMNGECFICGADRVTLEAQGDGFQAHIKNEHNMWSYAFMLVHLRSRDALQYNAWEAYVAGKLEKEDDTFLPHHQLPHQLREAEGHVHRPKLPVTTLDHSGERLAKMELSVSSLVQQMTMLAERSDRAEKLLEGLVNATSNATSTRSQNSGATSKDGQLSSNRSVSGFSRMKMGTSSKNSTKA